jgi:hypothetical protein
VRRIAPIILLVAAAAVFAGLRYRGQAPVATGCDPQLRQHVYRANRLELLNECTAVAGRVTDVHRNADGDLHVEVDPDDASVLNLVNVVRGGRLIVEVVCDHESTQADVRRACAGFTSKIAAPAAGDRIRAIGAYVKDTENGWNEVHPVSKIEVFPSRP